MIAIYLHHLVYCFFSKIYFLTKIYDELGCWNISDVGHYIFNIVRSKEFLRASCFQLYIKLNIAYK